MHRFLLETGLDSYAMLFAPIDQRLQEIDCLSLFHYEALARTRFNGHHYGLPVQTTPVLLV